MARRRRHRAEYGRKRTMPFVMQRSHMPASGCNLACGHARQATQRCDEQEEQNGNGGQKVPMLEALSARQARQLAPSVLV
jgi:hypothetical protein